MLYIDRTLVVNNDGQHEMSSQHGEVALDTGMHDIILSCFQSSLTGSAAGLFVSWTPEPGAALERLTSTHLSNDIACQGEMRSMFCLVKLQLFSQVLSQSACSAQRMPSRNGEITTLEI